jgi:hypothetical protein
LQGQRRVEDQQTVRQLGQEFNALKGAHGTQACGNDSGKAIVAIFQYRSGATNPVRVQLDGCLVATNGHLDRMATSHLVRQLKSLAHAE